MKRARYDFLLAALRLKASSGSLTDEDVAGVNGLLDPAVPLAVPMYARTNVTDGTAGPQGRDWQQRGASGRGSERWSPAVKAKSSPSKRPS